MRLTKGLKPIDRSQDLQPGQSFIVHYNNTSLRNRKDLWLGIIIPESLTTPTLLSRRHRNAKPLKGDWTVPVEKRAYGVYLPGQPSDTASGWKRSAYSRSKPNRQTSSPIRRAMTASCFWTCTSWPDAIERPISGSGWRRRSAESKARWGESPIWFYLRRRQHLQTMVVVVAAVAAAMVTANQKVPQDPCLASKKIRKGQHWGSKSEDEDPLTTKPVWMVIRPDPPETTSLISTLGQEPTKPSSN
ncbi:hypothetical protein VTN96DRAFT_2822 [Rasamsonia emersonii]